MPVFAYRGYAPLISAIEPRLIEAGFTREGEVELADLVITFCTNLTELEEMYFGEDGIVDRMKEDSCVVDLSACTPNLANEMNAVVTLSDLGMVCAPLMVKDQVSQDAFERANLSCFAAGEQRWLDEAWPLLEAIYGSIDRLGDVGLAQLARASNTLQKTSEIISAIESNSLLESSKRSISSLSTRGFTLDATSPEAFFVLQAIKEDRFDSAFTVEMLMGELSAAIMAADDNDMIIPQAEAAFHLLELLAVIGGSQKSPAALALVYGNVDEKECERYGLDWSRAEGLYGSSDTDDDHEHDLPFDGDIYDDEMFGDDLTGFGYSSN